MLRGAVSVYPVLVALDEPPSAHRQAKPRMGDQCVLDLVGDCRERQGDEDRDLLRAEIREVADELVDALDLNGKVHEMLQRKRPDILGRKPGLGGRKSPETSTSISRNYTVGGGIRKGPSWASGGKISAPMKNWTLNSQRTRTKFDGILLPQHTGGNERRSKCFIISCDYPYLSLTRLPKQTGSDKNKRTDLLMRNSVKPRLLLLLTTLYVSVVISHNGYASSRLPYNFYSSTVSIEGTENGSGFYVNTDTSTYLVTARHVLYNDGGTLSDNSVELLSYSANPADTIPLKLHIDLVSLNNSGQIEFNDSHDIAIIRVRGKRVSHDNVNVMSWLNGVTVKTLPETHDSIGVNINDLKKYKDVSIGNAIVIFGFPRSIGIDKFPQIDFTKPLLRKGIIAGKNDNNKTIIIDCPVYPGNSGGPVMEIEEVWITITEYNTIGVITQFIPFTEIWENKRFNYKNINISNSGYAVVEPMDYVIELIEKHEALRPNPAGK